jgi:hypothetical protein
VEAFLVFGHCCGPAIGLFTEQVLLDTVLVAVRTSFKFCNNTCHFGQSEVSERYSPGDEFNSQAPAEIPNRCHLADRLFQNDARNNSRV